MLVLSKLFYEYEYYVNLEIKFLPKNIYIVIILNNLVHNVRFYQIFTSRLE